MATSRACPPFGPLYNKGEQPWNRGVRVFLRKTLITAVWLFDAALAALIFLAISHLYRGANS